MSPAARPDYQLESRSSQNALHSPLLNLQAALGHSPAPSTISSSTAATSFGVKRRWDDDVIFKNQARGVSETPKKEFVNDLLRTVSASRLPSLPAPLSAA